MKIKKNFKRLVICFALCFTMLCGGTMLAHAVTPVCGGNHNFCKVRDAGRVQVGAWEYYRVGDRHFKEALFKDAILERCYCGMEQVTPVGSPYTVRVWLD